MRRAHSSRSWLRLRRRWPTSSRSSAALSCAPERVLLPAAAFGAARVVVLAGVFDLAEDLVVLFAIQGSSVVVGADPTARPGGGARLPRAGTAPCPRPSLRWTGGAYRCALRERSTRAAPAGAGRPLPAARAPPRSWAGRRERRAAAR